MDWIRGREHQIPACPFHKQLKLYRNHSLRVGLDVKAVGKHVEVQKGSHSLSDWTLEQWKSMWKSKREVTICQIGR